MATQIANLEKTARDFVNAGIGAYRLLEQTAVRVRSDVEKTYATLVSRGATDNSQGVRTLRQTLDQGLAALKGVQAKLGVA